MNTEAERLERVKFRFSLISTVVDKLLIAVFLAILGFVFSRALQSHKASLDRELDEASKAQQRVIDEMRAYQVRENARLSAAQDEQLEKIRGAQQAQLEAIRGSQQLQIEGLRASQNKQLEAIRGDQSRQVEILRGALSVRSNLSQRRITAYEQVYEGGVTLKRELDMIALHASPQEAPRSRHDALINFRALWARNRLFLSDHAVGKVDGFLQGVDWAPLQQGNPATVEQFGVELERTLERLRVDLQHQFEREERAASGGGA